MRFNIGLRLSFHFENFNLFHSEVLLSGQDRVPCNPRLVLVRIPDVRKTASQTLAPVANVQVVIRAKRGTIPTIDTDCSRLLLEGKYAVEDCVDS
jgi:hypothetical protein